MRSSLIILLVTGCSVSPDLSNLPCPCADGFVCQADRCVESPDSSFADAGSSDADPGADADTVDSSRDAPDPRDAPQSDGGPLEFLVEEDEGTGINFDWFIDKLRIDSTPGSSTFESAVIDAGRAVTWTRFTCEPLAAYGRAFSRVADPPYEDGRVDGMGLSLLMPFDRPTGRLSEGDEYRDLSSAARVGRVFGTGASSIPDGVFGTALRVTDQSRVEVSMSSGLMPATGEHSWSFWARSSQPCDDNNRVYVGSETTGNATRSHIWIGCWDGGGCARGSVGGVWAANLATDGQTRTCGDQQVADGIWHNIVVRKSGPHADATLDVFMDGERVFRNRVNYSANFQFGDTNNLWFGNFLGGYPTSVDLDAAVFFSRALDADEIVQLHQRGRQTLGFEVRVCADPTCAGVAYQNLAGETGGAPTGDDGSSDTLPLSADLEGLTGRYAQVRVTLSSSMIETPEVRFMRLFAQ